MSEAVGLFRLDGKRAAVIGAGSGIGAAVARGLAASGAFVGCIDSDGDGAQRVASTIGAAAEAAPADIRDAAQVTRVLAGIHDRGGLDIVVCTPGVNVRKRLLEYTNEDFERVIGVNLLGSFNVLREAGRLMAAQGRGSIVMYSSIRAQVVEPGQSVYAATKAAVVQLVRAAAAELGAHGVRVNAIAPGVVDTPLTAPIKANAAWRDAYAAKSVLQRWASADEMVGPTLFLCSDAASYVTGSVLVADGGWTAADGRFTPPGM
jgi:NAD(P)-dependent dehydrogenase (short-subunit alcohol dehydrogenase family)